jgi:glycosyltransferase involved in cell wall biosynthesis
MEPFISIVVPAYNEEMYLGKTLTSITRSGQRLEPPSFMSIEIIVVDNESTDNTCAIATSMGARVVRERARNISKVRNAGAREARGDVLLFIDADTVVPETFFSEILLRLSDRNCVGGAVDTNYSPSRLIMRTYLDLWRTLAMLTGMAQGATQFCRKEVFKSLGGYDETLYMGEDVDFYWRMKTFARRRHMFCCYVRAIRVEPSTRRFDKWPLWRIVLTTNPLSVLLFRRRKAAWRGWYAQAPR